MKKIYAVFFSGPCVGTDTMELVVAKSEEEAIELMLPEAIDWYGNWAHEDDYDEDGNLVDGPDIWAEEYNPEEHDGKYPGGYPSADFIAYLKDEVKY